MVSSTLPSADRRESNRRIGIAWRAGRKGPTKTGVLSKLPSSLHWFNNTSGKYIERRRAGLQEYLDKLLAPESKLKSDTAVSDFLGVRPSVAVPA